MENREDIAIYYVNKAKKNQDKKKLFKEKIKLLLSEDRFEEAKELYDNNKYIINYKKLENEAKRKKRLFEEKIEQESKKLKDEQIKIALKNIKNSLANSIVQADKEYFNYEHLLSKSKYQRIKNNYIENHLKQLIPNLELNNEQIEAVGELSDSVIIKARAGSGKTRVITIRTLLLLKHEKVARNKIMLLTFNKKAAEEIKNRFKDDYKLDFDNAMTFHSLAHKFGIKEKIDLLFDEETNGWASTQKQTDFIQQIIKDYWSPVFKSYLYHYFRQEIKEMEDMGAFLDKEDYYLYRRSQEDFSLKGEKVKSKGEKWIADFLFEHDIYYYYEKGYKGTDGGWEYVPYRPDFSLKTNDSKQYNVVIEHWGIDENDPSRSVPKHWNKNWQEYKEQMDSKRQYWQTYNKKKIDKIVFLETSVADMNFKNRDDFEEILKDKLIEQKIIVDKLSEEQLIEKISDLKVSKFSEIVKSYISNATKRRLSHDDLKQKIDDLIIDDKKNKIFYKLANKVYEKYIKKLESENKMDFDGLLESAIEQINNGKTTASNIDLTELEYLMIDEYQDFSPLFYNFIDSIKKINKNLKIFCVGDDWQAINSFAGSDLKFFNNFKEYFPNSVERSLLTNYRSAKNIVGMSNNFMIEEGNNNYSKANSTKKARIKKSLLLSNVVYEDKFRILNKSKARNIDNKASGVLKYCYTKLLENCEKKIMILSRTNEITGNFKLNDLEKKLIEFNKNFKLSISTIHSSKGLEADIVIVLNVNKGKYPIIHPNISLNYIFDNDCHVKALDEEKKLFYVAITRAKEKLYLLTEKDNESEYLDKLGSFDKEGYFISSISEN